MTDSAQDRDAQKLAELGYKQELSRAWSGFSNFAISFTIISVLAGCFTVYGQAWNNGGPIAISWAWPIICGVILIIAFSSAVFGNAGQDCCARSRILVERSALDRFMEALEDAVEGVRVGDPLAEDTAM